METCKIVSDCSVESDSKPSFPANVKNETSAIVPESFVEPETTNECSNPTSVKEDRHIETGEIVSGSQADSANNKKCSNLDDIEGDTRMETNDIKNSTESASDDNKCSMLGEAEDDKPMKLPETVPESPVESAIKIIDTNLDKAGGFMEASEIGSVKSVSVSDAKEQSDSLLQAKASKLNKNNTKAESTKHSCQICNREFSTHLALKSHERIHTKGQRKGKFACKICDKTFRKSANLTLHKKKDHPELKQDSHSSFSSN